MQSPAGKSGGNGCGSIPVLDLSPFTAPGIWDSPQLPEPALALARQWRETFASLGFAQIVGHGVPDEVIEAAYSAARGFFCQSDEQKRRSDLGLGYGPGGYTPQGVERVSATASAPDGSSLLGARRARPPDRVENILVHRKPTDVLPVGVDGYEEAAYRYHDEMTKLLRTIMRITACSLDLPINHFDPHFFGDGGIGPHHCIGECTLRLAYYPKVSGGSDVPPGQLRYGEHTDYTGFTILWQDHNAAGPQTAAELCPPAGGLQVQHPQGDWIDCPPVPGAFVINAGDLIQVWTNDVLLSNTHRVAMPPPDDPDDRISMVFFTGPAKETVIECLPTCCGPERPAKYVAITSGEHLNRKLQASNL